jgi:hypothetical protein
MKGSNANKPGCRLLREFIRRTVGIRKVFRDKTRRVASIIAFPRFQCQQLRG